MHVFRSIQEAWIPLMGFIVNIVPVLACGTSQKKAIEELPT